MKTGDKMAGLSILGALLAFVALGLFSTCSHAAVYDALEAKGFPRMSDKDSVTVVLYSFYEDGHVLIDSVRLPKPDDDAGIKLLGCVRLAPSSLAQCVIGMEKLGILFAKEVPLNIVET